ncbi:DNA double-strand break repair nuclease NurA [Priestia filamentosa]|uniref:DNA double-strand break repair nuclease NurA n=1 Tax=Priestia filamentosa TaxID=1402861 RepID=UPI00397C1E6E
MITLDEMSLGNSILTIKNMTDSKRTNSKKDYNFKHFKIQNHMSKIAAVDGSNHAIPGVNFVIAALRSGYLIYQDGELIEEHISKIKLETLINSNDTQAGFLKVYKDYFYSLTGEIPEEYLEFDKAAERLRSIMEWKNISDLVESLDRGDIVVFDGSFISGAISTNRLFFETLVSKAKDKGISLVGLSKDTSLSVDNVPIPSLLREAAKNQSISKNWYVEIPEEDTYFVNFTKESDLIFRVDIVHPDEEELETVLSKVGAYAFSDLMIGYLYPMQRIHDEVRISEMDKQICFEILKHQWIANSNPKNTEELMDVISEFDELFFNYHKQLDIISSGR